MPVKHDMCGLGIFTRGGIAAGQLSRAVSNGDTVPRGGANMSLTTGTSVVGIKILITDESGCSSPEHDSYCAMTRA